MVDLKAQFHEIEEEVSEAIKTILDSTHFILGPYVKKFEEEVEAYLNVNHALGVASGTDALHLALMALGIGEGDEVITTPFTFIATAEAITYGGAVPVFVDIDPVTLNIDPLKIEEKITPRTRCILPVHLFGLPADMDSIRDIAQRHNLSIIEDCAQAFGAQYKGKKVGSLGQIGCFSFYPSKNLGAYGDGGMVVTNDHELYEKLLLLRSHGSSGGYKHFFIGRNSRLDEIQAAILLIKLKRIDHYNEARQKVARLYRTLLSEIVICPPERDDRTHVYHQFTIRHPDRDSIQDVLKNKGIASVVYYPVPLHQQGVFKNLSSVPGSLVEAEIASQQVLSLPIYPEVKEEDILSIAQTIVDHSRIITV
jgi:UDP-2-acetamido-2-deoxy-ribo-hexuluronate aminotransferase